MPITYTSRKGLTYYLCRGVTKTGKPRYYFAREPKGEPVEEVPAGYKISESVNGVVSLVKDRPSQLLPTEIAAVEAAIARHPQARNYRLNVKPDQFEICERAGPDMNELMDRFQVEGLMRPGLAERMLAEGERYGQFTPVMRFILADAERRIFRVQRMCYLGSIDDWINLSPTGPVDQLAHQLVLKLGTDQFFELY